MTFQPKDFAQPSRSNPANPDIAESVGVLPADRVRLAQRRLLEMHFNAGVGHIGGNLSALDALLVLHHDIMARHDVFVLAKGHAAGALYIALWSSGRLSDDDLTTFHGDGTFWLVIPSQVGQGIFRSRPAAWATDCLLPLD